MRVPTIRGVVGGLLLVGAALVCNPAQAENLIVVQHSGKCLDLAGSAQHDGGAVHQWSCHGGANQRWSLEETSDGYQRLRNQHSGKCLDVAGVSHNNGARLHQWSCLEGQANQEFALLAAGTGYYVLQARHSGKCIDIGSWSHGDGAAVQQWDCHWGGNQRFRVRNRGDYTKTRHPIVLVHGLSGFDKLGGLLNYFFTIPYQLERSGAEVHTASVSAFNSTEQRGWQLLEQVQSIVAQGHVDKVNLIGHSQGAPTSRFVAAHRPQWVASVTSVNGVNKGSKVADVVRGIAAPDSYIEGGVAAVANALGTVVNVLTGNSHNQDALAALVSLSQPDMQRFNNDYPAGVNRSSYCAGGGNHQEWLYHNGWHPVRYYSWSGTSNFTNPLDPSSPAMALTGLTMSIPNDGLVDRCSSHLGWVIRDDYSMNHVDAINHVFGLRGWTNPVTLYRQQANRLRNAGL